MHEGLSTNEKGGLQAQDALDKGHARHTATCAVGKRHGACRSELDDDPAIGVRLRQARQERIRCLERPYSNRSRGACAILNARRSLYHLSSNLASVAGNLHRGVREPGFRKSPQLSQQPHSIHIAHQTKHVYAIDARPTHKLRKSRDASISHRSRHESRGGLLLQGAGWLPADGSTTADGSATPKKLRRDVGFR